PPTAIYTLSLHDALPIYGVQPHGARHSTTPGRCKGKAHKPEHLGIAGRRVLVSRKWSNKTLNDHRAERTEFVRQLLEIAGIQPRSEEHTSELQSQSNLVC